MIHLGEISEMQDEREKMFKWMVRLHYGAMIAFAVLVFLHGASYASAAPCPVPVAGAGVPAVSCERGGS